MNLVDTDVRHSGHGHGGYRGESFTGVTIFQRFMFTPQPWVSHSGTLSSYQDNHHDYQQQLHHDYLQMPHQRVRGMRRSWSFLAIWRTVAVIRCCLLGTDSFLMSSLWSCSWSCSWYLPRSLLLIWCIVELSSFPSSSKAPSLVFAATLFLASSSFSTWTIICRKEVISMISNIIMIIIIIITIMIIVMMVMIIIIITMGCRREAMARQANRDEAKKIPAIRWTWPWWRL